MKDRLPRSVKIVLASGAALALGFYMVRSIRARTPYVVHEELLSGWTVAAAPPGDTAVVEATPPSALLDELFAQLSERTDLPLVASERAAVPLVLSEEYSDSLQGVFSIQDIVNAGHDAGLDAVRFEPVCVGERRMEIGEKSEEVFYAMFDAAVFDAFRWELTPDFPEQAGAGVYSPPSVRLILPIASTAADADDAWPVGMAAESDCSASLRAD